MFADFSWYHLIPLAKGALMTIVLCTISGAIGTVFGMILGIAKTSPLRLTRWASIIYINSIRGVPVLMIIFFMYFGAPLLIPWLETSAFITAVAALAIFAAAYIAEIIRGSIEAVDRGQHEAAEALGLTYIMKFTYVIMPQALKIAIPPGITFIIQLVKNSSLVTVVGFIELTRSGTIVSSLTADPLTTYSVVAAMYFLICYGISLLGRYCERRVGLQ